MKNRSMLISAVVIMFALALASCGKDDDAKAVQPLSAVKMKNIAANPSQNPDLTAKELTNKFVLISLKDSTIIANSDSATTKWDIGIRSTTIIVNGGVSGPGQTTAQLVSGIFEEILTAPATGYTADAQGVYAIKGSAGWYNYTGSTGTPANAIIPVPGQIIVLKTSSGNYAKIEILSYYYGNPDTTTESFSNLATRPAARYYTFRYIYQADGTTKLN